MESSLILPILKYPGGKTREFSIIKRYIPDFKNYYEPFLGGGAVWLNVNADHYFVNDFSKNLMDLYKYLKNNNSFFINIVKNIDKLWDISDFKWYIINNSYLLLGREKTDNFFNGIVSMISPRFDFLSDNEIPELKEIFKSYLVRSFARKQNKFSKIPFDEITDLNEVVITIIKSAIYQTLRYVYNNTSKKIFKTALYWYLREFSYSAMFRFNSVGEFNVPYGGKSYNNKFLCLKLDHAMSKEVQNKLNKTELYNRDFEDFLNKSNPCENDFVFLDPPYDSEFSTYDHKLFDQDEHKRLAKYLKQKLSSKFMLDIKDTPFIRTLYSEKEVVAGGDKQLHIYSFDKKYQVSFKNRNNKQAKHMLITNYEVKNGTY